MSIPKTTLRPRKKSPSRRQQQNRRTIPRYRGLALEIGAKIFVNAIILTVAVNALNKLIPNYRTQLSRLEEVEQEVKQTQARVNQLHNNFTHNFDPYQSEVIMQKQTNLIKPDQRHIVWLEENNE